MHHSFDSYFRGIFSPDLVGELPEVRHLRCLETHLEHRYEYSDDPFLTQSFQALVMDLSVPPDECLIQDWVACWTSDGHWSDSDNGPATFVASLSRGGVVIAVDRLFILDFGGQKTGTCVRIHAPHFTQRLLQLRV